jgi:hypothetical protein
MVMKTSITTLIVVLVIVMSFAAAQAFDCTNNILDQMGVVCKIDTKTDLEPSKVWIDETGECKGGDEDNWLEIIGVPFGNLNLQLADLWPVEPAITFDEGDCVKVEYILKTTPSGDTYNKWCSVQVFYDELNEASCDDCSNSEDDDYCWASDESPIVQEPRNHRDGRTEGEPPWEQTGTDDPQP